MNDQHDHDNGGSSLQAALLPVAGLLLAGALFLRLADGSAGALVQSWYLPLLGVTAAVLAVLAVSAAFSAVRSGQRWQPSIGPRGLAGVAIIAIPVGIAFFFKPEPLGSANLDVDSATSTRFSESARSSAGERNVYQWAYLFATASASELTGQKFEAIGFVFHHPEAREGTFDIARFVVACCVADATGFTIPVAWPDAATLPSDSWVRVEGKVGLGPDGVAVVNATTVESIDPPANPYIYP